MRVQTMFGQIASGTHERLFGTSLVFLRVAFGAALLTGIFPLTLVEGLEASIINMVMFVVACFFILGLFTRPAGIVFIMLILVLDIAILPLSTVKSLMWVELLLMSVAFMGLAGGIGNAFGLNGFILRNIPHPHPLIRFLFG